MNHFDFELSKLKHRVIEMMELVYDQLSMGKDAVLHFDKELASQILKREMNVNKSELKIDTNCENILALFNPVAVDLRFVMAAFKINSNLERIGDNAEAIARHVIQFEEPLPDDYLEMIKLDEIYDNALKMFNDVREAFINENTMLARKVFPQDKILNKINRKAAEKTMQYIRTKPDSSTSQILDLLSIVRKLERTGDLSKNNAEEIIFYLEAKVLKHRKKKKLPII